MRGVWLAAAFCLIYAAVDIALNSFGFSKGWTILWPLNGVSIAILLMRPRSDWFPILIGIGIGTGIGESLDDNTIASELALRLFSVSEVLISALLLPAFSDLNQWLRKPHIFERFAAALVLGPGLSAIMAALFFHHTQGQSYLSAFSDWANGDALGIAATMPLALTLRSSEMRALFQRAALPRTVATLLLALLAVSLCLSVSSYPLLFLLFPVLLFVDSQLGFSGSAITVAMTSFIAVYLTTHSRGPFGLWPHSLVISGYHALQIYLGFHILAHFPTSIVFTERIRLAEELRDSNAQLTMLAAIDGLTGIANRRALDERFAQEWNRAIRLQTPLSYLMIDVDHFKQFNDRYGHYAGDQCLQSIAEILSGQPRRAQDLAARFGGEEFAIILPHTSLDGAAELAERIRESVFRHAIPHHDSAWACVTVSIGCACLTPGIGDDRITLLNLADTALYRAKEQGRNRINATTIEPAPTPTTV
jgi:diguanylate cyclase (GGDEF)-like protein